jgi:ATP-dependent exoDNAse (exonuclease V) alpha subunit
MLPGKVLIVDEAGMVSGKQMQSLLHLAQDHSARIIFSGDTRQIRSVEASDALRILETESGLKSISLTGVQRQTNPDYREAIKIMRSSPEQAHTKRLRTLTKQFVKIERSMVNWVLASISIRKFPFSGQQRKSWTFPTIKKDSCFNSTETLLTSA